MVDFCCKYCGSTNLVRYGRANVVQYWWCKDCKRKFADNSALPHMRTPIRQVASALSMYYGGTSLNAIRRHLEQQYDNYPSNSTVYEWIRRFTKIAASATNDCKPDVGDVWIADETVLRIGGKKRGMWFWDIMDAKTRFVLASHISSSRTVNDALTLMEKASERAGKSPKLVITDKLQAYLDGVSTVFGRTTTTHIQSKGFDVELNTNLIERFHETLKDRTKVMRGFKKPRTARLILDGWLIHYNFFRPHEALKNKTPAEKAGLGLPFRNWLDVMTQSGHPVTPKVASIGYSIRQSIPIYTRRRLAREGGLIKRRKTKQLIPTVTSIPVR